MGRLVATAVNVERLTGVVISELLAHTAALQPARLIDPSIDLWSQDYTWGSGGNWPAGQWYQTSESCFSRKPSWVEIFRVRRALWELTLLISIRAYAWQIHDVYEFVYEHSNPDDDLSGLLPHRVSLWGSHVTEVFTVGLCLEDIAWRVDTDWTWWPSTRQIF